MGFLFPILLLGMGGYVLFSAIKGSGRLFNTENFKEESKGKAKKIMRSIYFALAAIMLILALVNAVQTVLYSEKKVFYKVTQAYKDTFDDLYNDDGQLDGYTEKDFDSEDMAYKQPQYNVNNEKMDQPVINAFIQTAYGKYQNDTEKFPKTSSGAMSCMGASVDYSKYYEATDLLKVVDGEDVPVYGTTDAEKAEGHVVYVSQIGKVRSDANDGSFISKLYGVSANLWTILNYVFLGLAVVAVIGLFVTTSKFTDKEKLAKARAQATGQTMPSGAFNFDDEEPKTQDAKKE
jgi:flagellar basal body-associated protein FliL